MGLTTWRGPLLTLLCLRLVEIHVQLCPSHAVSITSGRLSLFTRHPIMAFFHFDRYFIYGQHHNIISFGHDVCIAYLKINVISLYCSANFNFFSCFFSLSPTVSEIYRTLRVLRSRVWPFWVTWRHRTRYHLIPHWLFYIDGPLEPIASISNGFRNIQWRMWRNGSRDLKRPLNKGQCHSFGYQSISHMRLPIGCQ